MPDFDEKVAHVADEWYHGEGETFVPDGKAVLVDQLPPHDTATEIVKDTKTLNMVLNPDQKLVTPKGEIYYSREPKLVVEVMNNPVYGSPGLGGGQAPAGQAPGHYIGAGEGWVDGGGQAPAVPPPPVPNAHQPPPPPHVPAPAPRNARISDRTKYIAGGIAGLVIALAAIFTSLGLTIWSRKSQSQIPANDPPPQPLPDPPTTLDFDVPTANQSVPFTSVQVLDASGAGQSTYHDPANKCTWTVLSNNHVTFTLDTGVTLPTAGGSITEQFVLVDNQGNQSTAGTLTVTYAATTPPAAAAVSPVAAPDRTSAVPVPVLAANVKTSPGFAGQIQLIDPATNKPVGPGSVADTHSPSYGTWSVDASNNVTFAPATTNLPAKNASATIAYAVIVNTLESSNMPSLVINFPDVVVPTGPSATFVKSDTTTLGNWIGVYGKDGYMLAGDSTNNPSYVTPAVTSQGAVSPYIYDPTKTPLQPVANPLQKASGTGTVAAEWYADAVSPMPGVIVIDLPFTDTLVHQIAVYFDDYDTMVRQERIDIVDTTGKVLSTQSLPIAPATNFTSGVYLIWNVSGHVQIRITDTSTGGINCVASAVFFDPSAAHATVLSIPPKPNDYPISNGSRDYPTTFSVPGKNPGLLMATDLIQLVSGAGPVQMLSTPDGDWEVQLDNTIKFIPTIPCTPDNVVQGCVIVRAGQQSPPATLTLTFTRTPEAYPCSARSSQRNVQFSAHISTTSLTPDGFASVQLYKDATTTTAAGLNLAVTGGSFQIASSSATVITCEVTDPTLNQIQAYYAVTDKNGVQSNRAAVTANVVSPMARNFLLAQGVDAGKTLAVNVLANSFSEWGTDPASVVFVGPVNVGLKPSGTAFFLRDDKRALQIRGEGAWLVDDSGLVTFTAEPAFKGAPTPITFQFADKLGNLSNPALVLFHPKLADIAPAVQKLAEQSDDDFWTTFKTEIDNEIAKGVDTYWPNELIAVTQAFVSAFRPLVPNRSCPIAETDYQAAFAQWTAAGQPADSTLFDACVQLSWNATKTDANPLITRYWALSSIVWILDESL